MDADASSSTARGRTHILVVEYNVPKFSRAKNIFACIFFLLNYLTTLKHIKIEHYNIRKTENYSIRKSWNSVRNFHLNSLNLLAVPTIKT